jgi:lipid-binding SYLF domain-containing protein
MKKFLATTLALAGLAFGIVGCATAPKSEEGKQDLRSAVNSTLTRMQKKDEGMKNFVNSAYAYVMFPVVGKGGFIFGGAYGRGEVYEQGQFIGYADISQASVGAQVGGQSFAELITFEDKHTLDKFVKGGLKFEASASAVALKSGAAAAAKYTDGVAIFVEPQGGLMAEAAIGGQSFSFQPVGERPTGTTGGTKTTETHTTTVTPATTPATP